MTQDAFEAEAVVIGAGAVGLACALALARAGYEVLVLEASGAIGGGVSSRNSEVIHAGLYHPADWLKHRLAVHGRRRLYPYLAAHGVAHRKCGKLVVACDESEISFLETMLETRRTAGVENLRLLSGAEARALESNLNAVAALHSPETGILDAHGYMRALLGDIEAAGGALALNAPVLRGAARSDGRFELEIGGETPSTIVTRKVVNAAGLSAQRVAQAIDGMPAEAVPPLVMAKGSYFSCAGAPAFSRLIYPAPVLGGLGTHLTLDMGGAMRFGPDVEWVEGEPSYEVDAARGDSFYAAIRRYWPALRNGALTPAYAGVRPKLSRGGDDFRIDGAEVHGLSGWVNLFGVESPGLTASLAIGEEALARLEGVAVKRDLKPAIFFDRDGTLNRDDGYTYRPEQLRWIDGAIDAIRAVNAQGWLAIVATNQSGIGRGLYDEAQMHAFHEAMQRELAAHGAHIDAFYFSPFHEDATVERYRVANHPDRKPNPGMLLRAMREQPIDPLRALMIGDGARDVEAAHAAGLAGVLLEEGGNVLAALKRALAETAWAREFG